METRIDEIAPRTYRISTFVPGAGLTFNQFLLDAEEPLLFHTGMRALFPQVRQAMSRVMDPVKLRWIAFGHYEADECGAMNEWLAIAPQATVMHGAMGVMVSIADQAARPPRGLRDGETIDLGDRHVTYVATPHVPHGWDAGVLYDRDARTLFAGDLFTAVGDGPVTTSGDIVAPALATEDLFHATALGSSTAPTIRRLSELDIGTLGLMHAPAYRGDAPRALRDLADAYAARLMATVA
jgi:flavorubredoxin